MCMCMFCAKRVFLLFLVNLVSWTKNSTWCVGRKVRDVSIMRTMGICYLHHINYISRVLEPALLPLFLTVEKSKKIIKAKAMPCRISAARAHGSQKNRRRRSFNYIVTSSSCSLNSKFAYLIHKNRNIVIVFPHSVQFIYLELLGLHLDLNIKYISQYILIVSISIFLFKYF